MMARVPLPTPVGSVQRMIMPAIAPRRWTAEEVRALPDNPGTRYECVDGELLVSPAPSLPHQSVVARILVLLSQFVDEEKLGAAFAAPADLELDAGSLVQPDVFVLPLVDGRRPRSQGECGRPLLFVEALSPTTARYDRVVKRRRYQRAGIESWIVDLDARLIERWFPDAAAPEVCTEQLIWHPSSTSRPLVVALIPLFAEALGPA
jgi:Uma2 family endonuclease